MKTFSVTIRTTFTTKHFTVTARSSAEALISIADEVPLHGAVVTVSLE